MMARAVGAYELPHSCETAEVAAQLAALTPRQRRVLREYVWKVALGEATVTDWLRSEGCPVSERAWYDKSRRANYLHNAVFQDAISAYLKAGQRWLLEQDQRQIGKAKSTLIHAAPRAAARLVEQAEADQSAFWKIVERWTDSPLPSQEIVGEKESCDEEGNPIKLYLVRQACLDLDKLTDPRYARLVKTFSDSPKAGLKLEFYDAQRAAESVLDRADPRTAGKAKIAVTGDDDGPVQVRYDLSQLTTEQLDQLAGLAGRLSGAADGAGEAPAD